MGSVHVRQIAEATSEFGMLVAAPDQPWHRHRSGPRRVRRAAQPSAKDYTRSSSSSSSRETWRHPSKEFLNSWYSRIGYRVIGIGSIDDTHPHLAPLLATPCDFQVWEKPLVP